MLVPCVRGGVCVFIFGVIAVAHTKEKDDGDMMVAAASSRNVWKVTDSPLNKSPVACDKEGFDLDEQSGCRKFFRCLQGKRHEFECPSGSFFNPSLETCHHTPPLVCRRRKSTDDVIGLDTTSPIPTTNHEETRAETPNLQGRQPSRHVFNLRDRQSNRHSKPAVAYQEGDSEDLDPKVAYREDISSLPSVRKQPDNQLYPFNETSDPVADTSRTREAYQNRFREAERESRFKNAYETLHQNFRTTTESKQALIQTEETVVTQTEEAVTENTEATPPEEVKNSQTFFQPLKSLANLENSRENVDVNRNQRALPKQEYHEYRSLISNQLQQPIADDQEYRHFDQPYVSSREQKSNDLPLPSSGHQQGYEVDRIFNLPSIQATLGPFLPPAHRGEFGDSLSVFNRKVQLQNLDKNIVRDLQQGFPEYGDSIMDLNGFKDASPPVVHDEVYFKVTNPGEESKARTISDEVSPQPFYASSSPAPLNDNTSPKPDEADEEDMIIQASTSRASFSTTLQPSFDRSSGRRSLQVEYLPMGKPSPHLKHLSNTGSHFFTVGSVVHFQGDDKESAKDLQQVTDSPLLRPNYNVPSNYQDKQERHLSEEEFQVQTSRPPLSRTGSVLDHRRDSYSIPRFQPHVVPVYESQNNRAPQFQSKDPQFQQKNVISDHPVSDHGANIPRNAKYVIETPVTIAPVQLQFQKHNANYELPNKAQLVGSNLKPQTFHFTTTVTPLASGGGYEISPTTPAPHLSSTIRQQNHGRSSNLAPVQNDIYAVQPFIEHMKDEAFRLPKDRQVLNNNGGGILHLKLHVKPTFVPIPTAGTGPSGSVAHADNERKSGPGHSTSTLGAAGHRQRNHRRPAQKFRKPLRLETQPEGHQRIFHPLEEVERRPNGEFVHHPHHLRTENQQQSHGDGFNSEEEPEHITEHDYLTHYQKDLRYFPTKDDHEFRHPFQSDLSEPRGTSGSRNFIREGLLERPRNEGFREDTIQTYRFLPQDAKRNIQPAPGDGKKVVLWTQPQSLNHGDDPSSSTPSPVYETKQNIYFEPSISSSSSEPERNINSLHEDINRPFVTSKAIRVIRPPRPVKNVAARRKHFENNIRESVLGRDPAEFRAPTRRPFPTVLTGTVRAEENFVKPGNTAQNSGAQVYPPTDPPFTTQNLGEEQFNDNYSEGRYDDRFHVPNGRFLAEQVRRNTLDYPQATTVYPVRESAMTITEIQSTGANAYSGFAAARPTQVGLGIAQPTPFRNIVSEETTHYTTVAPTTSRSYLESAAGGDRGIPFSEAFEKLLKQMDQNNQNDAALPSTSSIYSVTPNPFRDLLEYQRPPVTQEAKPFQENGSGSRGDYQASPSVNMEHKDHRQRDQASRKKESFVDFYLKQASSSRGGGERKGVIFDEEAKRRRNPKTKHRGSDNNSKVYYSLTSRFRAAKESANDKVESVTIHPNPVISPYSIRISS